MTCPNRRVRIRLRGRRRRRLRSRRDDGPRENCDADGTLSRMSPTCVAGSAVSSDR